MKHYNPTSLWSRVKSARIKDLIKELRTRVGKISLVVNRVNGKLPSEIGKAIDDFGLSLITTIPEDPYVADLEIKRNTACGSPSGFFPSAKDEGDSKQDKLLKEGVQ
ncbi:MAG: hypothetical protein JW732_00215 [Dehalococcoidia bacterium]|nr:hypothetical protein [Dehalococcoidia bacterium]